jgi:hypothetical protein
MAQANTEGDQGMLFRYVQVTSRAVKGRLAKLFHA